MIVRTGNGIRGLIRIAAGLVILLHFNACATIFSDGQDTITFKSNVDKVKVFFDNSLVGETPLVLPVDRQLHRIKVRFSKEGYASQEMLLAHKLNMNAGMILDVTGTLFTLTPMAVDALSGNLIRYSPTQYHIEMVPEKTGDLQPYYRRIHSMQFAALNFEDIRRDLLAGGGDFLDALTASFRIPADQQSEFRQLVRNHLQPLAMADHGLALWQYLNLKIQEHPRLNSYHL